MKSMETGRQDGGSDKNHAPFSVGKTGNISRKFLTIILKIFDKNFERLHTDPEKYLYICNRFREEDKNNLEDMDITEYVPEVENPSVESLTENDCFFLTAEILR